MAFILTQEMLRKCEGGSADVCPGEGLFKVHPCSADFQRRYQHLKRCDKTLWIDQHRLESFMAEKAFHFLMLTGSPTHLYDISESVRHFFWDMLVFSSASSLQHVLEHDKFIEAGYLNSSRIPGLEISTIGFKRAKCDLVDAIGSRQFLGRVTPIMFLIARCGSTFTCDGSHCGVYDRAITMLQDPRLDCSVKSESGLTVFDFWVMFPEASKNQRLGQLLFQRMELHQQSVEAQWLWLKGVTREKYAPGLELPKLSQSLRREVFSFLEADGKPLRRLNIKVPMDLDVSNFGDDFANEYNDVVAQFSSLKVPQPRPNRHSSKPPPSVTKPPPSVTKPPPSVTKRLLARVTSTLQSIHFVYSSTSHVE